MIKVGQTYEHIKTGVMATVVEVEETWHNYGLGGEWKSKLVPRLTLMVVAGETAVVGHKFHETVPTGDLCHYGYTRLA